jgi:hypothetical protein
MQMKSKVNIDPRILIVIFLLVSTSLACQIFAGGPQLPSNEIPNTGNAGDSVEQILGSAFSDATGDTIAFTLTEDQLTSFIAEKIANHPDIPINNPQILLDDGRIDLYGSFDQSFLTANFRISMEPAVASPGDLRLEISETDFGPLPVPQVVLDTISTAVNSFLSDSFVVHGTRVKVDEIFISDGFLTVQGTVQQD